MSTKCPDYFKTPTGEVYACVGTDGGYYWAEDPNNPFECLKFEQSECEAINNNNKTINL
jgi:hypothetical protein